MRLGRLDVDGPLLITLTPADIHTARLGGLVERDPQREDPVVELGVHVVDVQHVTEHHAPRDRGVGSLPHPVLGALRGDPAPFRIQSELASLDLEVDAVGGDARQVELDRDDIAEAAFTAFTWRSGTRRRSDRPPYDRP